VERRIIIVCSYCPPAGSNYTRSLITDQGSHHRSLSFYHFAPGAPLFYSAPLPDWKIFSPRATVAKARIGPAHAAAARRLAAVLGEETLAGAVATLSALSAALDEVQAGTGPSE
jgi:hypothetical protein